VAVEEVEEEEVDVASWGVLVVVWAYNHSYTDLL
jgi:hypothetical protein